MSKEMLRIKACKCILVLPENELLSGLKPEILQAAIQRGKAYKRTAVCENRQAQVDRWRLYEALKGNRIPDDDLIQAVETMPVTELREGTIEYLLTLKRKEKTQ